MPSAGALEELDVQSPGPNPEQALSKAQEGERLLGAVQRLPLGYRQVVTLALEGFGYGEIADVLGISESNVGARLTRARQMLRQLL
jgi:RNA polymerase sigma-70 factor (ECF subfamily)